jgi:hypothetical protein
LHPVLIWPVDPGPDLEQIRWKIQGRKILYFRESDALASWRLLTKYGRVMTTKRSHATLFILLLLYFILSHKQTWILTVLRKRIRILLGSRIRIRIRAKLWIWIRIKIKSRIRIRLRIRIKFKIQELWGLSVEPWRAHNETIEGSRRSQWNGYQVSK